MISEQIKDEISRLDYLKNYCSLKIYGTLLPPVIRKFLCQSGKKQELVRRYKEYKEGKLALRDWNRVHKELRDKYK